jgi:DNA polymerase-1
MVTAQIFDMTVDELHSLPPAEYKLKRRIGKNTNFGFIFGAGERKIELTAGMPGLSKILAQRFPHATEYMAIVSEQVRQRGFVQTLGGYRLSVPKSKPYSGVCYIVQGTEGEIVKDAMIEVAKYLFLTHAEEAYITLQVHDSIIVDFPLTKTRPCKPDTRKRLDDLRYIAGIMERAGRRVGVETPAACEKVAYNWGEPVKLDLGSIPRVAFGRKRKRVTL